MSHNGGKSPVTGQCPMSRGSLRGRHTPSVFFILSVASGSWMLGVNFMFSSLTSCLSYSSPFPLGDVWGFYLLPNVLSYPLFNFRAVFAVSSWITPLQYQLLLLHVCHIAISMYYSCLGVFPSSVLPLFLPCIIFILLVCFGFFLWLEVFTNV